MKNVYFNHDGNVDDLVSLLLLLQVPHIKLTGVSVIDGDGVLEPAVLASRKIIDRFNQFGHKLEVASSTSRARHQFPSAWRTSSYAFDSFPLLNEAGSIVTPEALLPAHLDMVEKIHAADGFTTLVMTGPLTDLARALDTDPTIQDKIDCLYWMGGSLDGHGNVHEPGHDGTAEWNAYWDPEAVKRVWDSNLKIVMVGLESTEEIPLDVELRNRLAKNRRYPAVDLAGQGYALVMSAEADSEYYLWDVLTTICSMYPEVVETEQVRCDVIDYGFAAGRTYRTEAGEGRIVDLVTKADHDAFYQHFDELLMSAAPALY
ncbi:nucleoside hydrolase [Collinsella sp. zg1085]|uniref:nucleoside hydrolase n=1 Tax=Collinsella sp. zg1085 TaxID=2844380 RepID=UPI001C0BC1DE|nr:nucleoside hydrolase [Collinsella sp. zg1085]QWT17404.1 nucleoside hydrolase [Collinsella sp. zg1085]